MHQYPQRLSIGRHSYREMHCISPNNNPSTINQTVHFYDPAYPVHKLTTIPTENLDKSGLQSSITESVVINYILKYD